MNDTSEILSKVEDIKKELINSCPFKKGDCLEWINKGKTLRGRFDYVYIDDKLQVAIKINLPVTSYIKWTSSYEYIKNPDYSLFKLIESPVLPETVDRIYEIIRGIDYEIKKKTELLTKQKNRLQKLKTNYQNSCVHEWEDMGETGETRKTNSLFGNSEHDVHAFYCKHCGKEIESI